MEITIGGLCQWIDMPRKSGALDVMAPEEIFWELGGCKTVVLDINDANSMRSSGYRYPTINVHFNAAGRSIFVPWQGR